MSKRAPLLALTLVLLALSSPVLQAGKPAPPKWTCQVTLRDADGDVIRSDGKGAYADGQGGVSCTIDANPASVHFGWLYLYFPSPRTSTRSILYMGQAAWQPADTSLPGGPGYGGFASRGTFEVKGLTKIAWNGDPTYVDIMPFRANVEIGQFMGDSNWTGSSNGASSVFVQPIDAAGCTWDFSSNPAALYFQSPTGLGDSTDTRYNPRVILLRRQQKGGAWVTLGFYPMPFGATVRIVGGKSGC